MVETPTELSVFILAILVGCKERKAQAPDRSREERDVVRIIGRRGAELRDPRTMGPHAEGRNELSWPFGKRGRDRTRVEREEFSPQMDADRRRSMPIRRLSETQGDGRRPRRSGAHSETFVAERTATRRSQGRHA